MKKAIKWAVCALTGLAGLTGVQAVAADYPDRPVKIIVAYGAGSGADIIARILSDKLTQQLKQPVVVANLPGVGGELGTIAASRAAPDGYTLLFAPTTLTVSPHMAAEAKYDATKDFAPIMRVATLPMVLVSSSNESFSTWDDLVKGAKSAPDALHYATSGIGSPSHLEVEMFAKHVDMKVKHVPYRTGSQALADAVGGQVSFYFPVLPAASQLIKSGRLNALAIGSKKRSSQLPNVPTLAEVLAQPDYEAVVWYGLLAPAGTPRSIIERLANVTADILSMPDTQQKIANTGSEVSAMTTEDFTAFIVNENSKWGGLVRELDLQK